jgi:hypothetical protein
VASVTFSLVLFEEDAELRFEPLLPFAFRHEESCLHRYEGSKPGAAASVLRLGPARAFPSLIVKDRDARTDAATTLEDALR